jgi:hypothetical protein
MADTIAQNGLSGVFDGVIDFSKQTVRNGTE